MISLSRRLSIASLMSEHIKTRQLQIKMPVSIACAHCRYPIDILVVMEPSDTGVVCRMCGKTSYVINNPS